MHKKSDFKWLMKNTYRQHKNCMKFLALGKDLIQLEILRDIKVCNIVAAQLYCQSSKKDGNKIRG